MKPERVEKPAFSIIGKEGSTDSGEGFIQRLWEDANSHIAQVMPLAKTSGAGELAGVWGAMTDFTRQFLPWEEGFSQGLYLAGIECRDDARAPDGWVKWTVPGFVYLAVEAEGPKTFHQTLEYMRERGIALAGAVQEFTRPRDGKSWMYFPIERM